MDPERDDYDDPPSPPAPPPTVWALRLLAPILVVVAMLAAILADAVFGPMVNEFFRE